MHFFPLTFAPGAAARFLLAPSVNPLPGVEKPRGADAAPLGPLCPAFPGLFGLFWDQRCCFLFRIFLGGTAQLLWVRLTEFLGWELGHTEGSAVPRLMRQGWAESSGGRTVGLPTPFSYFYFEPGKFFHPHPCICIQPCCPARLPSGHRFLSSLFFGVARGSPVGFSPLLCTTSSSWRSPNTLPSSARF